MVKYNKKLQIKKWGKSVTGKTYYSLKITIKHFTSFTIWNNQLKVRNNDCDLVLMIEDYTQDRYDIEGSFF